MTASHETRDQFVFKFYSEKWSYQLLVFLGGLDGLQSALPINALSFLLQEAGLLVLSASQFLEPGGSTSTVFAPAVAARLNFLLDALDKQVRPEYLVDILPSYMQLQATASTYAPHEAAYPAAVICNSTASSMLEVRQQLCTLEPRGRHGSHKFASFSTGFWKRGSLGDDGTAAAGREICHDSSFHGLPLKCCQALGRPSGPSAEGHVQYRTCLRMDSRHGAAASRIAQDLHSPSKPVSRESFNESHRRGMQTFYLPRRMVHLSRVGFGFNDQTLSLSAIDQNEALFFSKPGHDASRHTKFAEEATDNNFFRLK